MCLFPSPFGEVTHRVRTNGRNKAPRGNFSFAFIVKPPRRRVVLLTGSPSHKVVNPTTSIILSLLGMEWVTGDSRNRRFLRSAVDNAEEDDLCDRFDTDIQPQRPTF